MIDKLNELIDSGKMWSLALYPKLWHSLVINRRKPHTYRLFTNFDGYRVCLHKFDACLTEEAFFHPHPWPAAFKVLYGGYKMKLGLSSDLESIPKLVAEFLMKSGSSYEITNPLTWHTVVPLCTTYTAMINGPEWDYDQKHISCKTTKGKDLDKMSEEEIEEELKFFRTLLCP